MFERFSLKKLLVLTGAAILLALLLIDHYGKPLENIETKLYQKITGKGRQLIVSDSAGIPMIQYQGKLGKQYNPLTIAEQALIYSDKNDPASGTRFWDCINWFIKNKFELNDSSDIYLYHYDWPAYQMISPWRSAMCQGRVIQVFVKAYERTGDTVYLGIAKSSMNALFTEVKNGGVTYKDTTGYWYEEYADDQAPQSRVLNGMIVVLQGLKDYYDITKDPSSLYLFNMGVRSLICKLPEYDNDGHSYYDILGKPAKPWYHNFHIELLKFIYSETGDPVFKEYIQKWSQYKEPSYLRSIMENPTRIGIFTIFTIFFSSALMMFVLWFLYESFRKYFSKEG